MKAIILFAALIAVSVAAVPRTTVQCEACKVVVNVIDHWLDQGKTVTEIEALVTQLCAYLPSQYADVCNAVLDSEIEQVIQWVEQFTPEVVCQKLKVCTTKQVADSTKCAACTVIVDMLEAFITDETTDQQIIKELDRLCAMIAHSTICEEAVKYGIEEFVKLIRQKLGPAVVCKSIGMC